MPRSGTNGFDGVSDEDLVRRARAGDDAATHALFERHARPLRARARRGIPAALQAKVAESDVVQEAWLAALQRLGEFEDRGEGSFARWLHTVVKRKILDEKRRYAGSDKRDVRRERVCGSSAVRLAGADPGPSPSGEAIAAEEGAAVRAAILRLGASHREVLRLVHEEHLTIEAAAARMGRTLAATKKLYGRAVLRLAEEVRDASEAEG